MRAMVGPRGTGPGTPLTGPKRGIWEKQGKQCPAWKTVVRHGLQWSGMDYSGPASSTLVGYRVRHGVHWSGTGSGIESSGPALSPVVRH